MKTYHEAMQANPIDNYSNFIGNVDDIKNFLVAPVGRSRDSRILEESNFTTALDMLGGESEAVQVHRFGHCACGWFEIILIDPTAQDKIEIAESIESALADYPILDESDYSDRQYEAINDLWDSLTLQDRIYECKEAGDSIFAARRETVPECVWEQLGSDL